MENALASPDYIPDFLREIPQDTTDQDRTTVETAHATSENGTAVSGVSAYESSENGSSGSGFAGSGFPNSNASSASGNSAPEKTGKRTSRRTFPHDENTLMEMFQRLNGPAESVRGGDRQSLRDRLVLAHTSLVEHCARSFSATGEPVEDLLQEGYIGLIKAVDRFDPNKGVRFSTYACHLIAGEMRHYLRDLGKLIHEPGWHSQLRARVVREAETLTQKLGRPPRSEEIASSLSMQPQLVRTVLDTQNTLTVESLDGGEDSEGNPRQAAEERSTGNAYSVSTHVENHMLLDSALPKLRDLEQRAVKLFFYNEFTKTEIARELGISVNYASYLVKRGIEHLRRILEESEAIREQQVVAEVATPLRLDTMAAWLQSEAIGKHVTFAVLIMRIQNWESATSRMKNGSLEEVRANVEALARRCSRLTDTVVPISGENSTGEALGGLYFAALLPNTDAKGLRVGERWASRCTSAALSPKNPAAVDALLVDYAFATFPNDGQTADALMHTLEAQL
jgi:RNA polymerase sigma-B factor